MRGLLDGTRCVLVEVCAGQTVRLAKPRHLLPAVRSPAPPPPTLPPLRRSAPCFLTLRYASLGLTLGAQRIRSVYVLQASVWEKPMLRTFLPRGPGGLGGRSADGLAAAYCACCGRPPSLTPCPARLNLQSAEQIAAFACDSAALRLDVALPSEVDPFELEGTTPVRAIRCAAVPAC